MTFNENGLPGGTQWSATLDGNQQSSSSSSIVFNNIANGSHPWSVSSAGFSPSQGSGTAMVSGNDTTVPTITFTPVTYSVKFTESGLPSGTPWTVTLQGTPQSQTTPSIVFQEANGSYSYSISTSDNRYSPSPASGMVTVDGGAVKTDVTFSESFYSVTFTESGLPPGTQWMVTLNGTPQASTTNSIAFSEPNGLYLLLRLLGRLFPQPEFW